MKGIANWRFPIGTRNHKLNDLAIGNRQSAIGNQKYLGVE